MDTARLSAKADAASERLPFRVEIASRRDLGRIVQLRAAAYGKHMPAFATQLQKPEPADFEEGCEVFVALSKFDGSALGTLRTHANIHKPLPLQASLRLPGKFGGTRMVETTRLSIAGGIDSSVVRSALFKALHQYCLLQNVDWMMAAGRRPVDRIYDGLMFSDVDEPKAFYPMAHAGGVPHRVMSLAPASVQPMWGASDHALYRFFFETAHADIDLSRARNLNFAWDCPETLPQAAKSQDKAPALVGPAWPSFGMALAA